MMNNFRHIIILFLLLIIQESYCQTWEHYNQSNSDLPSDNVTSLSASDNGNIWISTIFGIAKYDTQIQTYSINNNGSSDNILNIWAVANDSIWVGTEFMGLWKFNGVNEWIHYHPNSAGNGIVGFGIDSRDTVWILDKFGNFDKWNGNSWVEISDFFSQGNGLFIDSQDNVWLLSNNAGLQKYFNGELLIHYKSTWFDTTRDDYIPSGSIHDMLEDSNGNYWIGSNTGLLKFDSNGFTVYTTENSGIASNKVRTLAIDENDVLWIGTWDNGISKFNGSLWTNYNMTNSPLESPIINDIEIDKEGKVWIANGYNRFQSPSGGKGVFVFDDREVIAPTNLVAVQMDPTSVELSWNDNSPNEDFHYIYRSHDGITFEHIASAEANITEYLDESLDKGTEYYYKVSAVSGTLSSDFSETVTISLILNTEYIVEPTISVFPNPALNYMILNNPDRKIIQVRIHDLGGKIMRQFEFQSQTEKLDISNLKGGIYVLKISSFDTEQTIKIIKQ